MTQMYWCIIKGQLRYERDYDNNKEDDDGDDYNNVMTMMASISGCNSIHHI